MSGTDGLCRYGTIVELLHYIICFFPANFYVMDQNLNCSYLTITNCYNCGNTGALTSDSQEIRIQDGYLIVKLENTYHRVAILSNYPLSFRIYSNSTGYLPLKRKKRPLVYSDM